MNKNQTNNAPEIPKDPPPDFPFEPACSTCRVSAVLSAPASLGSVLVVWTVEGSWVTGVDWVNNKVLDKTPVTVEEIDADEKLTVEVVGDNVVAEVLPAVVTAVLDDVAKGMTFGFRFWNSLRDKKKLEILKLLK